jgi:deoxyribose-phosphate aldolase
MRSSSSKNKKDSGSIAHVIDHTLLRTDTEEKDIQRLCREAELYGFAAVCVHPVYVRSASRFLTKKSVAVCAVVGFPSGAHLPEVKGFEARRVLEEGADEMDMVLNIGAIKSGRWSVIEEELRLVVGICREQKGIIKVIIETPLLTTEEKLESCRLICQSGADFVKTCTGFGPGGATVEDVNLLKQAVSGTGVHVKASGGIRSYSDAMAMIQAGACRIGTSRGIQIVREESKQRGKVSV